MENYSEVPLGTSSCVGQVCQLPVQLFLHYLLNELQLVSLVVQMHHFGTLLLLRLHLVLLKSIQQFC